MPGKKEQLPNRQHVQAHAESAELFQQPKIAGGLNLMVEIEDENNNHDDHQNLIDQDQ